MNRFHMAAIAVALGLTGCGGKSATAEAPTTSTNDQGVTAATASGPTQNAAGVNGQRAAAPGGTSGITGRGAGGTGPTPVDGSARASGSAPSISTASHASPMTERPK